MLPLLKPINYLAPMLVSALFLLVLFSGYLEFPSFSSPIPIPTSSVRVRGPKSPFTDLAAAFELWDSQVGCDRFRSAHARWVANASAIQADGGDCAAVGMGHVSVLVKGWTWIPDSMNNLYSCRCEMTCLWTKSPVLADHPDAMLFESATPPLTDILVYWSSSRCLPQRNQLAQKFFSLISYHSFGKCLNNVGGPNVALSLYPECSMGENSVPHWWDHLHCAMSHYKFVLAIENTMTESYVTEKLYYALDSGAVPIYFGAPNVWDFVPPNSIIDGSKFSSLEELASYIKELADDPIAYAEYHAWRRCGVMGNYGKTRATSLDTLPCRLCEFVSRKGGRNARAL
ncbi:hypothetical protein B296_00007983 [Ensete ventricosum]|uniref:Fucosyltransferase n=1 Tax=Ensete ventricosum TaxID=4639 RepID=A0A427AQL2_ENSVE|nr:hypothetical protein B296_00007983 [Ensete ventricosum]